ncbi:MAG: hypothetical protein J7K59_01055 [Candidatus Korarchaeota archaeon]|nr:hypothetical protein [Candidatus Korarchaeota archaeon]
MTLINIWNYKAHDLIRDITVMDINDDEIQEIIFSSWDGNIYVIKGDTGSRIWRFSPDKFSGPAERIVAANLNNETEKYIYASFHKNLLLVNLSEKAVEWGHPLDSWILYLNSVDINNDGRDEVIAITRKGSVYGLDFNGEVLWKYETSSEIPLHSIIIDDINFDGGKEIFLGGSKPTILDLEGGVLQVLEIDPVVSATFGVLGKSFGKTLVLGHSNGISLFEYNKIVMSKKYRSIYPYIIKIGDPNGDFSKEIILADWITDSIRILAIDEEKGKMTEMSNIQLGSNVTEMLIKDIDGNDQEEIIVILENNTGMIIQKNKKIDTFSSYGASLGLHVDEVLNFGNQDLLVRTGREEISLMVKAPRIYVPNNILAGENNKICTISLSGQRISPSKGIEIAKKKLIRIRRKFGSMYLTLSSLPVHIKSGKEEKIAIVKGKKKILEKRILPYTPRRLTSTLRISFNDEDIISIDPLEITSIRSLDSLVVFKLNNRKENHIKVGAKNSGNCTFFAEVTFKGKKPSKEIIHALIAKSLEVSTKERQFLFDSDIIVISIKNNSNVKLKVRISGDDPIEISDSNLTLEPLTGREIKIPIKLDLDKISDFIKGTLRLYYKGLLEHMIPIPLNIYGIKRDMMQKIVSDLKEASIRKDEMISKISELTKIPPEIIPEILSLLSS